MSAPDYSLGSVLLPGLSKVVEESGELGQVVGKVLGLGWAGKHWDGSDLTKRLGEEVADLCAALDVLCQLNPSLRDEERRSQKHALFLRWHEEQSA